MPFLLLNKHEKREKQRAFAPTLGCGKVRKSGSQFSAAPSSSVCQMPAPSSRRGPRGSRKRPADEIAADEPGPAGPTNVSPPSGTVVSFLSPASALLNALQQDDPLSSMPQADKDALGLVGAFCSSLSRRLEQLGVACDLGPCHRPCLQPSTAAQLWGNSVAAALSSGDAAAAGHSDRRRDKEEEEQAKRSWQELAFLI